MNNQDKDASLINIIENEGEEINHYPVDESIDNTNAGNAIVYLWDTRYWEIIEWNNNVINHIAFSKTISNISEYMRD